MKIKTVNNLLITSLCAAVALPLAALTARAQDASPAASEAAATAAPEATASPSAKGTRFYGAVSAVDTSAKTVTILSKKGVSKTFTVTDSSKLSGADGSAATLADIKTGDHVRVSFKTADDGTLDIATLKVSTAAKSK